MRNSLLTVTILQVLVSSRVATLKCYNCWGREEDCPKNKLEANKEYYEITCRPEEVTCIRVWQNIDHSVTGWAGNFTMKMWQKSMFSSLSISEGKKSRMETITATASNCYKCYGRESRDYSKRELEENPASYEVTCSLREEISAMYKCSGKPREGSIGKTVRPLGVTLMKSS